MFKDPVYSNEIPGSYYTIIYILNIKDINVNQMSKLQILWLMLFFHKIIYRTQLLKCFSHICSRLYLDSRSK